MENPQNSGGLGISIAQIPSDVQNNPNAGIYIVEHLWPSQSYSQRIEVSNSTNQAMDVLIYPGAATNKKDNFVFLAPTESNDLTSWTSVSPASATIPAHSYITANVIIDVPSSATFGEKYGVIWASTNPTVGANGILSVNRVGIRMYNPVGAITTPSVTAKSIKSIKSNWISDHSSQLQLSTIAILLLLISVLMIQKIKVFRKKRRKRLNSSKNVKSKN